MTNTINTGGAEQVMVNKLLSDIETLTAIIESLQARLTKLHKECNGWMQLSINRAAEIDILNVVQNRLKDYHHPDCNWWTWDWKYSWSPSDCTCNQVGVARNRGDEI